MSTPTVFRPTSARILRRVMRYTPFSGGYSLTLQVGDARFITPVIDRICNEGPDPQLLQLYAKVLPGRTGTFLDIGANVGQTLLAVRSIEPGMAYAGFEPNVTCVAYMRALMRHNSIRDAIILPFALMDQPGFLELQLFYDNEADPSASLLVGVRPEQSVVRSMHVPGYTWEQIKTVLRDREVSFVKIDVEGAELEVLFSIELLLQTQRPWMLIEILPAYSAEYSDRLKRQSEIERLLARHAYRLLRVKKDGTGQNLSHLEPCESIGVHGNIDDCDYLVVPDEAVAHIAASGLKVETAA